MIKKEILKQKPEETKLGFSLRSLKDKINEIIKKIANISILNILDTPWYDARKYATDSLKRKNGLSGAINKIGSKDKAILITNQQDVSASITVPANITLKFMQGGFLNIDSGKTVTINGHVEAGLYQIFTGSGTVTGLKECYPEWWGAVGDGATDDTTTIHAARDATGVGGVVSFLGSGREYLVDGLTANVADQTWLLEKNATIKLADNQNTHVVTIGIDRFKITGGILNGNKANQSSAGEGVHINADLSDIEVSHMHIKNTYASSIRVKGSSGAVTNRVRINYNKLETPGNHAIYFNWEVDNSEICFNMIISGDGNGIWVGNTSRYILIHGNDISGVTDMGIEVWENCHHAIVSDNRINIPGTEAGAMGISIGGSDYCVVSHNIIKHTTTPRMGIELGYSQFCIANDNIIEDASIGISIDGQNYCQANDNIIKGTSSFGIQVIKGASGEVAPNYTRINGNFIISAGDRGININGSNGTIWNTSINDNQIFNCDKSGIYLLTSNETVIDGNIIKTNNQDSDVNEAGIYFNASTAIMGTNHIRNNNIADVTGGDAGGGVIEVLDDTGTPSVKYSNLFITGGTTTITDFDNGYTGKVIHIIAGHAITITDGTNIFLGGGTNWIMASGDTLTLFCQKNNNWNELARSDISAETYSTSNVGVDRTYDADATTTDELADVLGTLIADLQVKGIIK